MANPTYELISSVTVGAGGVSSIAFSSIPSTFTDLLIKLSARDNGDSSLVIYPNGSSANGSSKILYGTGAAAGSAGTSAVQTYSAITSSGDTANTFGNAEVYIPNYASSNYKSVSFDAITENNGTTAYTALTAGLWSNTAAITSLTLLNPSGNLQQYSTFYLYGIKNS